MKQPHDAYMWNSIKAACAKSDFLSCSAVMRGFQGSQPGFQSPGCQGHGHVLLGLIQGCARLAAGTTAKVQFAAHLNIFTSSLTDLSHPGNTSLNHFNKAASRQLWGKDTGFISRLFASRGAKTPPKAFWENNLATVILQQITACT